MRKVFGGVAVAMLLTAAVGVGSAVGAALITSADIKNKSIKQKDMATGSVNSRVIKDRSIQQKDLAFGIVGAQNLGTAVQDVVVNFTVPSGKTIQGAVGGDFASETAGGDWGVITSLPLKARNDLTDADVSVNVTTWTDAGGQTDPTTTDANPGCTGTVDNPTAPAGEVCIYVAGGDNAADLFGYSVEPGSGGSPYGFKLAWTSPITGDTYIDAVWAYHAA